MLGIVTSQQLLRSYREVVGRLLAVAATALKSPPTTAGRDDTAKAAAWTPATAAPAAPWGWECTRAAAAATICQIWRPPLAGTAIISQNCRHRPAATIWPVAAAAAVNRLAVGSRGRPMPPGRTSYSLACLTSLKVTFNTFISFSQYINPSATKSPPPDMIGYEAWVEEKLVTNSVRIRRMSLWKHTEFVWHRFKTYKLRKTQNIQKFKISKNWKDNEVWKKIRPSASISSISFNHH
jgi:hypothetical protein